MRRSVAVAVVCLSIIGLASADDVRAAIRKPTNIPAQSLGSALQLLAKDRNFQIVYVSEEVNSLRTEGAVGEFNTEEALKQLLKGTGLAYRYLDDKTVTILPVSAPSGASASAPGAADGRPTTATSGESQKEEQDRTAERFLLAQATSGQVAGVAPVESQQKRNEASEVALQEVIVTAEKREEKLQNVPISMSVLTAEALDRSTAQGVSEALNAVPGVATTETYIGGGTNIEIRGVGAAFPLFSGSSAVAYYLDSVPFGLVKSAIGPDADAYDLARVEVLRGPQGTLYGASALNGVVRILTNDADLSTLDIKARASGSVSDGGGENARADATINVPIVENVVAARATVGYQHDSGWINQPDDSKANYTNIGTYRLKVNAQPTQELSIGLFAWRSQQTAGGPDLGHTFDQNSSLLQQPLSTDYDAYGLKIAYQFPWFTITSATSYLDYENDSTLGLDVPGFGIPGSTYYTQLKSNVASEELNLNSLTEGPWRWSLGGIYRHGIEDLYEAFTVIPFPPPSSQDTSKSYAVYGELTRLLFDDRLEITAGVRHFHDDLSQRGDTGPGTPSIYASTTAEANTPRGIVTWHVAEHLMTYVSYSQGFRSGFPQETSLIVLAPDFPSVRPDRLRNYEIGTKGSALDGRLAFDMSLYHMDWNDIQLQLTVPFNGLPYPGVVNGARAKGNGVDASLAVKLTEGLTLSPYVSWNDLAIQGDVLSGGTVLYHDGDRPSGSPSTSAGVAGNYTFAIGSGGTRGEVSASASYTSPLTYRSVAGPGVLVQESNSILIARMSLGIDFTDHFTLRLYGDNINNWHGTTVIMFPGVVPDWQARVRPLTVGLQGEYHLR